MKNSRAGNRLDKFALSPGIYFAVNTPDNEAATENNSKN
jgi:hypothetical protein